MWPMGLLSKKNLLKRHETDFNFFSTHPGQTFKKAFLIKQNCTFWGVGSFRITGSYSIKIKYYTNIGSNPFPIQGGDKKEYLKQ